MWGSGNSNGNGSYTKGTISLSSGEELFLYVGVAQGNNHGATDVRLSNTEWNDSSCLISRIMVAASAGSSGVAGGLSGYAGSTAAETPLSDECIDTYSAGVGTQTSGGTGGQTRWCDKPGATCKSCEKTTASVGTFGIGGNGAGGSGNIGGGAYTSIAQAYSSGGSSFISGLTGCAAVISSSSTSTRLGTDSATCLEGSTDNLCRIYYSGNIGDGAARITIAN